MKCWEQGDIDEKVILRLLFNVHHDKGLGVGGGGWGTGKMTYTAIPLGLLGLPWVDLTEKAWNQTLTHLSLPGLKLFATVATHDSCTQS